MLDAAAQLFALPQADKDAVAMVNSPHFRGYTRLGGELTGGWSTGASRSTSDPERVPLSRPRRDLSAVAGPQPVAGRAARTARPSSPNGMPRWPHVGRKLLQHWAASLGSPEDVFDAAFADTPATLIKIVRYPAHGRQQPQGVGAHRDAGVLTLLLAEPGSRGPAGPR